LNEYLTIGSTSNGIAGLQIKPQHLDLFHIQPDEGRFMTIFNALAGKGKGRVYSNRVVNTWEKHPEDISGQFNAAATALETVLPIEHASLFRKGEWILSTRTREQFQVISDNGPSSVSVTVRRGAGHYPAAPILSGDRWIRGGRTLGENHQRVSSISREAATRETYIPLYGSAVAISQWRAETEHWGLGSNPGSYWMGIRREAWSNFNHSINRDMYLAEKVSFPNAAGEREFRGDGIRGLALMYNRHSANGPLTKKAVAKVIFSLCRDGGMGSRIIAIMGHDLITQLSLWPSTQNQGIERVNGDGGSYGTGRNVHFQANLGEGKIKSVVFQHDNLMDADGLDHEIVFLNFDRFSAGRFGKDIVIEPSAENPQGSADRATGTISAQMTRSIALIANGATICAAIIDGIDGVGN
jgi:hypothetical protein